MPNANVAQYIIARNRVKHFRAHLKLLNSFTLPNFFATTINLQSAESATGVYLLQIPNACLKFSDVPCNEAAL